MNTAKSPEWLRERVNDGYGTPNKHQFWDTVDAERIGLWKVFQKDGMWYGYKTTQNAWTRPMATREEVVAMATGRQVDIWA